MHISEKGLALIRQAEGLRLSAYKCPAGIATIGYGHTAGVKMGQVIDQAEAKRLLLGDVVSFELAVLGMVKVPLTQGQFDALVSFAYNLGPGNLESSTLLRLLNAGLYADAANQFSRWNKAGGKVLAGLTTRRAAEKSLFEGIKP